MKKFGGIRAYCKLCGKAYVVMSEKDLSEESAEEIIVHESAHIDLRHSWDVFFADIFTCLQWFNPAVWLLKAELRNIHEYEADKAALDYGVNAKEYQLLLIKKAVGAGRYSIANSLNHSKLKNRITMMLRQRSTWKAKLKLLCLLPLVFLGLTAFSQTAYLPTENKSSEKIDQSDINGGENSTVQVDEFVPLQSDRSYPVDGEPPLIENSIPDDSTDVVPTENVAAYADIAPGRDIIPTGDAFIPGIVPMEVSDTSKISIIAHRELADDYRECLEMWINDCNEVYSELMKENSQWLKKWGTAEKEINSYLLEQYKRGLGKWYEETGKNSVSGDDMKLQKFGSDVISAMREKQLEEWQKGFEQFRNEGFEMNEEIAKNWALQFNAGVDRIKANYEEDFGKLKSVIEKGNWDPDEVRESLKSWKERNIQVWEDELVNIEKLYSTIEELQNNAYEALQNDKLRLKEEWEQMKESFRGLQLQAIDSIEDNSTAELTSSPSADTIPGYGEE